VVYCCLKIVHIAEPHRWFLSNSAKAQSWFSPVTPVCFAEPVTRFLHWLVEHHCIKFRGLPVDVTAAASGDRPRLEQSSVGIYSIDP
jgi:hypothetical protein